MTDTENNLDEFMKVATGFTDAGLVVVKGMDDIGGLSEKLEQGGFKKLENVMDFNDNKKAYIVLGEDFDKGVYDLITQYASGQIELLNKETGKSVVYKPDYVNGGLILLVSENNLNDIWQKYNLLQLVGPVYRN